VIWQQKYLEKMRNFCFHNVHLRKNVEDFEILPSFRNLKTEKKNPNSKPHTKCRSFQGLFTYVDNSNVTKV
jgi:hypothetical protein